jgi:uncharacterized protein (AIM24 family)
LTTGDGTKTVYVWFRDVAGNTSTSYSDTIILDMTAPPMPSGLTATAVSSSQINQSWSAVVDTTGGSGLAGYKVYRSVTQIGTTTATNYSDYGLTANTQYCYRVASYDNAGNASGQCTQVCATTQSGSQPGAHIWSQAFGTTNEDRGYAVVTDSVGNVVITGSFNGVIDFGGGALSSMNGTGGFLAKYSPGGVHQWSRGISGLGSCYGRSVAVDASGNIMITGYLYGTVDFGGGSVTSAGGYDIFVAKYSGFDGSYLWAKRIGGSGDNYGYGVALDGSGNIVITGSFNGAVDFGGGALTSAGSGDIFIVKYTGAGGHVWSKRFGGASLDSGNSVAVDASGNVVVTGSFNGAVDFGGGALTSTANDVFIVKYTGAGGHVWSKRFGGTASSDSGNSVAVDASGNVVVTGKFYGTMDCGGGTLTSVGGDDIFIVKYTGAGGHVWSKRFGGTNTLTTLDAGNGVTIDNEGNVVVTGNFYGTMDCGGGTLTSVSGLDIFIVKYTGAGEHIWSERFGGTGTDDGLGVAVDDSGYMVITGRFGSTVDFGGELLSSVGSFDIFLVQFAP